MAKFLEQQEEKWMMTEQPELTEQHTEKLRHRRNVLALVLFVVFYFGVGVCVALGAGENKLPTDGTVVDVYDGDTLTVVAGGENYKCRLLGIDAPELSNTRLWTEMRKVSKYTMVDGRREMHDARNVFLKWAKVTEAHGVNASNALAEIAKGKIVRLHYDGHEPAKDKYGRLLVYVSVGDTDVNAELIRRGLVVADIRFSCDRLQDYVKLWRTAQTSRVGMWGQFVEEMPRPVAGAGGEVKTDGAPLEIVGSRNSDKYHLPTCRWVKNIAPGNRIKFRSVREAKEAGYKSCRTCKPPTE